MECPVCGCDVGVAVTTAEATLVSCDCCDAVWLSAGKELERILVGPED